MLLTRTRLSWAMPALRRDSSNDYKLCLCLPTPFVKNIPVGTTWGIYRFLPRLDPHHQRPDKGQHYSGFESHLNSSVASSAVS